MEGARQRRIVDHRLQGLSPRRRAAVADSPREHVRAEISRSHGGRRNEVLLQRRRRQRDRRELLLRALGERDGRHRRLRVATDPDGDQVGGPVANSDVDIESVSVAEPYDPSGAENVVFTLKVKDLSTLLPGRAWRIVWDYPVPPPIPNFPFNGIYYVGMNTDDTGAVSFEYGTVSLGTVGLVLANPVPNSIGPVDGKYFADGTIRITVPRPFSERPRSRRPRSCRFL